MHKSEYLYGVSSKEWAKMPYKDAIEYRTYLAKKHVKKLVDRHSSLVTSGSGTREEYMQLNYHIGEVNKCIEFNENLLKEIEEDEE